MALKFIVSSSKILKQLQQISGVLNSSNPLPILDNFLFVIEKGILTASASDLESTMTTQIELVEGKQAGSIAIPAKILLETLKTFQDHPLTFVVDDKQHQIEIVSDNGKYKLTGFNADEFPRLPGMESAKSIEVSTDLMSSAISKTLFATGNDELRPVMSGVFCQFGNEGLTFVATDAHKLVRYRRTDVTTKKEGAFILPKKPLNLLKNILSTEIGTLKISFTDNNAFFETGNFTLTCRLIDGRYPNYEAVIPTDNPNCLTIERTRLMNSVKRVSIFSNKTTHQVRLKINGSELQISAEDLDFANEANERLGCDYTGEDMEIGFNARFLMDMLNNLEDEMIKIEMSAPNRAGILTPAEITKEGEDILMLVMPVMLNN